MQLHTELVLNTLYNQVHYNGTTSTSIYKEE